MKTISTHVFRKLKVWQRSLEFVTYIYKITQTFPPEEKFGLTDQLRRAAVSINLNISEGAGSGTNLEFSRFLKMSLRSGYETISALMIAYNLKYISEIILNDAVKEADEIGAMTAGLIKSLKSNSPLQVDDTDF